MAAKSRKLRAAIKAILEPAMEKAGFTIAYPHFRRTDGDILDLVELQHWKDGGAFIIEMARVVGPFTGPFDPPIPRKQLEVGHIPLDRRERLGPGLAQERRDPRGWFRYDKIWDDRPALDAMMRDLVDMLPQMEAWLAHGTRGPNIDPENT